MLGPARRHPITWEVIASTRGLDKHPDILNPPKSQPRAPVMLFAAGNLGWALGCIALLAGNWIQPTPLGIAWVLAQAATVAVLAELQWTALRRYPVTGWA